ncbi:hypothetical protein DFS33DRAFT_1385474 [Desarmillaria ectypa]|nr:hypothetical protein DFS33DRAFT_1385474 [Desarmillaria ectypa]
MEILDCGVVQTSENDDDDMTVTVFVRASVEISDRLYFHASEAAWGNWIIYRTTTSTLAGGNIGNAKEPTIKQLRRHKGRKHVRIVFTDVGVPLHDVQRHDASLFAGISDALKGNRVRSSTPSSLLNSFFVSLYYLFIGHYVHRDTSASNTLPVDGIAKISDLEYAKMFLPCAPKYDLKMVRVHFFSFLPETQPAEYGTPTYMAVDVQALRHPFNILLDEPGDIPFLDNYLHYVESLSWVDFYALFSAIPAAYTDTQLAKCHQQYDSLDRSFPRHLEGGRYRTALLVTYYYRDAGECLPLEYQPAVRACNGTQNVIRYLYGQVERLPDFPQHEHFNTVHSPKDPRADLSKAFQAAAEAAEEGWWRNFCR